MSESLLLSVAVFVFVMMMLGLALTIWEFSHGQPRREDQRGRSGDGALNAPSTADAA